MTNKNSELDIILAFRRLKLYLMRTSVFGFHLPPPGSTFAKPLHPLIADVLYGWPLLTVAEKKGQAYEFNYRTHLGVHFQVVISKTIEVKPSY